MGIKKLVHSQGLRVVVADCGELVHMQIIMEG